MGTKIKKIGEQILKNISEQKNLGTKISKIREQNYKNSEQKSGNKS
jgi:hypothetical protein